MTKVFIDGGAGTTGLRIVDRLSTRDDIELIVLPEQLRKDLGARKEALNSADIVFLCLPDAAAKEAVTLIENSHTAVIDTSTAHRTNAEWTYGFPELLDLRNKIKSSKRIANPGCHASGFLALIAPLVSAGILDKNATLSCFSLTGYSGGGKAMIAEYESDEKDSLFSAPRQYGLGQHHKHLPEMTKIAGLINSPAFCPIVGDFYSGMEVTVPVFLKDLMGTYDDVISVYKSCYTGKIVHFDGDFSENGFLSSSALSGRDDMQITAYNGEDKILLTARFDNLGKGASGAAIQNMNILLGVDETVGLTV